MTKNMKKQIIALTALIMATTTACQKENQGGGTSDEFRITASLNNYTKATDTDFAEGDVIGVFVTENGGELKTSGNYDSKGDNLEYSYQAGSWEKSGEPLKWKDFSAVSAYGYSPKAETVSSITAYPFTVPADQSDDVKYGSADFLWAKKESVTYGNNIALSFAHKMSNVVINITMDPGITAVKSVTITNVLNECTVNLQTGVVADATAGTPTMVLKKGAGQTYKAILAPQTISNKDLFVITATVDGKDVVYTYSVSSLTLVSGKRYPYNITLKQNEIKVEAGSITDWLGKDEPAEEGEVEGGPIPTKALITASFAQNYDLVFMGEETLVEYLAKLKEAGIMELVIDQAIEFSDYSEHQYISLVPITSTELENGVSSSQIKMNAGNKLETILDYCETNGMKVFVGPFYDKRHWVNANVITQADADRDIAMSINVMNKILELYGTKYPNALHGWYFSWEINNVDMQQPAKVEILKSMFTKLLTEINRKPIRRPLLMSPYSNETGGMTAAQYSDMWKGVLTDCPFRTGDILAPQDCIGTAKITSEANYNLWMKAYADAVASKKGMEFWINVELFNISNPTQAEPFTDGRVEKQLKGAANYATKILSFSYFYHYCRNSNQNHLDYLDYKNQLQ